MAALKPSAANISTLALAGVESLYDAGRYFTAHARAVEQFGPLAEWQGGAGALVLAGRLAGNLGGHRLSYVLTLRARRRSPHDPTAALFHAYRVYGRRGPFAVRRLLRRPGVGAAFEAGDDEIRANGLCLRAHVAANYRDADAAESLWQQAHALRPVDPWTWRERAALFVTLDHYAEALDAAREALCLRPWYRPAVQQLAHTLTLLERDDEAARLLEDALDPEKGGLESPSVAEQLAGIYAELRRPADALRALDRVEALSVLSEEPGRRVLASRRGEARLLLDDLPGAADAAEALAPTSFFHARTAERLRDPARQTARRVVLPVPFVRQHEKTCAPATLAALSRFWNRPADQADITREIWYGGTLDHQERRWAEGHGWAVREFRADWPSAVAAIDAGIPFALATTGINSGHLQAGIGYDARRGTLVIRDPYERNQSEPLAEEFFERHAFSGPRALALVPADDSAAVARLRATELPEAELHDGLYALRRALFVHDRPAARAALDALETLDPGARLTWLGRREIAAYDGDDPAFLAAVDGLLTLFPTEGRLRLEKLWVLRRLARPLEARAALDGWVADPTASEPNLWRERAVELAADARQRPAARQALAHALYYQPTEPAHLRALADLCWEERDFAESAALGRLAACAAGTREDFWQRYFTASRHLRETDEAIRLLDARFRRLGEFSAQPARTLFRAHRERQAPEPAAAVLAEALRRRPDDGETLLFAATAHARDGEHARAAECLAAAQGKAAAGAWERAAAALCDLRGDLAGALAHWRGLLAREPLDASAHQAAARLLAETDPRGPAAAREALAEAVARFPHAVALHELRVQSLVAEPGRGSPEHVAAVGALLEVQPANVWAHRERALACLARNDPAAALNALDEAGRLDPLAPPTHALRGRACLVRGERAAARESLRRACTLDAGLPGVPGALLEACATPEEKRAELDFIHGELARQAGGTGDGIPAYREAATPFLDRPELLARLDALLAARPDLWQAWSAVAWQLADAGRLDEARARAAEAAERFPLQPSARMDLAAIDRIRGDDEGQIAALQRVLRIHADHGEASRQLAAAHRRAGRWAEAGRVLEQAVAAAPLDVANRGALAETRWQEGSANLQEPSSREGSSLKVQAIEIVTDALRREPGYEGGWQALERYATALGQPERLEGAARLLTTTRPGEARSWLQLARTLPGETGPALTERLAALDRALALNPRSEDAHDLRATLLAVAGRFDEALAACQPPAEAFPGGTRPCTLEGRAAWVLARRGDLPGARARMRALLADQPGYDWGWRMLADWAEAAGDKDEAFAAAERLAFLDPHAAGPLGYLAAAHLEMGRGAEAKRALLEAMRRDPKYVYAPATLLKAQLADGELEAAEETLRFFERHYPGPWALSRTVLVAVRGKEPRRAAAALAALVRSVPAPGEGDGGLREAVKAVVEAGWRDAAEEALHHAIQTPGETCHPDAAAMWVESRTGHRRGWKGLEKTVRSLPEGEGARRARRAYLSAIGNQRQAHRLGGFLRKMRRELCADTASWGQAGFALVNCGQNWKAARWMADWRERQDAEGWMLFNLGAALQDLRRYRDALAVHRHALTLKPDHTRTRHAVQVAQEDALADDAATAANAQPLHDEVEPQRETLAQPYRYLHALTGQVLAVRGDHTLPRRKDRWREARAALRKERREVRPTLRQHSWMVRADYRARRRMARDAGRWWTWFALWLFASPPADAPHKLAAFLLFWVFGGGALIVVAIVLANELGWL